MSGLLYAVEIALAFGLVIFIHELGHFLAARRFGVRVRKFAIGMGPPIVTWGRGDTEFSFRWVPLGGFVDVVGEHPDAEDADDPKALWRRPPWQRAIVFAGGVFMNGVLAVVLFTVASLIGVRAPSPVLGEVVAGSPASEARTTLGDTEYRLEPGDCVVAVDDTPVDSFTDVMTAVVMEDAGTRFDVTVRRGVEGMDEPLTLTFRGITSRRAPGSAAPTIGVAPAYEPVVGQLLPGSLVHQAGLKPGDRFVLVDGRAVRRWGEVQAALADAAPGPVAVQIERDQGTVTLTIDPAALNQIDLGLEPAVAIRSVDPGGPADEAGVREGDVVTGAADVAWPDAEQLQEVIRARDGGTVNLRLLRAGETVEVTSQVRVYGGPDFPRIGVALGPEATAPFHVASVEPGGPAAEAGIQSGDAVVRLADGDRTITPGDWGDLAAFFGDGDDLGAPRTLVLRRGQQEVTVTLTPDLTAPERFVLAGSLPAGQLYEPLPRVYNPAKAVVRGLKRTWLWLGRGYQTLSQLLRGQLGRQAVSGPVMIIGYSYKIAGYGLGTFLDFWGTLSVFVAIFNFLPMPPFDGGHVLFILIEKLKGGRVNIKVRNAIWIGGWVLVGGFFLFVLVQDISSWSVLFP